MKGPWFLSVIFVSAAMLNGDACTIADFEGRDYGEWVVEGDAFRRGPVRGALPDQMEVAGYQGRRLVNSYYGGDDSTGMLTSPEYTVERPHSIICTSRRR